MLQMADLQIITTQRVYGISIDYVFYIFVGSRNNPVGLFAVQINRLDGQKRNGRKSYSCLLGLGL